MKKTLSLLLVLAMVLSSFTAFAGVDTVAAEVQTHKAYIAGISDDTFAPKNNVTRQQIARMIAVANGLEKGTPEFKDANEIGNWAKDSVGALQKAGIVVGDEKGNFNPKDEVKRSELAIMLVKAYENIHGDIEVKDISFKDVADDAWYAEAVKKAATVEIVAGIGNGKFDPNGNATREQAVAMVNRMLGLDKVEGVEKLETEFKDVDKWSDWAKNAILVASTDFNFVEKDGKIVIVTEDVEEVKVEELEAVIAKAEKAAEDAVVGEKDGNYPKEAVDALKAAIKDAKAVLENKEATQEEVDKAAEELTAAIKTFEEKVVVVEELKVVEVSAINANYVVVKITAPEKDMLAQEVEVKNGAGVVVPVKPLDIAAGDKTAEFEFVTAVKAADLKGVWTVNDQSYDLDLYNNLSAFLNAGDQLALNKALTDLGIKNVDIANMPAYFEAKDELDKTALELTVADVQKLVDDVNAKFVSAEEEAAIVKAVVDSLAGDTVNQVALLQALQNKAFVRVNADWVADATNGYAVKLKGANLTKDSKIKDIQTVINTSNDALIKAELDKLKTDNDYTELDKAKLTKVKNLIATYATVDDKGVIDNADIKAAVEGKVIEIQLALADVVAATTPTSLKNRVVALNELLAKENKIDMEKEYIDANAKDYITQIEKNKVNTVTKLKTAISTVNTSASSELLDNVKNATDADALLKALKAFPGLKQVSDTNKDLYYKETTVEETTTKNVNFKDVTADTIQKAVDDQNLVAIKAADKDSIIEKLNVLELKNVVAENAEAYAKSAKASEVEGSISKATDAETMQKAVNAVNQTVVENAQLKAINEAKTVAEVKSALDALANVDKAADYLTIRSVDRDFVAAHVLENRPEENGYAKIDDVETAIGKEAVGETSATGAIKAYHEALDGINSITRTSTPVEVANALGNVLDEDFAKLSNTEKTAKAEAFQAKLTFDEKGALKTTFVTLADVKALLK